MSWTREHRHFWVEREDTFREWRNIDGRWLLGPLYVYTWHHHRDRIGKGVRYTLWRQRPWRTKQLALRGPLLHRNGHPWGIRIRWRWRGWSDIGPPWNLNIWSGEGMERDW